MKFRWLRRLFSTPSPLDPEHLRRLPRGLEFALYEPADFPALQALYRANDDGRLPAGFQPEWERLWQGGNSLRFVCRRAGEVVGCCAVCYQHAPGGFWATLSFGLVRPDLQRRGIGTAQLLVRLAQLQPGAPSLIVILEAVPSSKGYYHRFGFRHFHHFNDPVTGRPIQTMRHRIPHDLPRRAGAALTASGITFPHVPDQVPTATPEILMAEAGWDGKSPIRVRRGKAPRARPPKPDPGKIAPTTSPAPARPTG